MTTGSQPTAPAVAWTDAAATTPPAAVEAGTLLATAPPGALSARAGVVEITRPGAVELRAARDGTPLREADGVAIDPLHVIEGVVDRSVGDRDVLGALRVEGWVTAGRHVGGTGGVLIAGAVDRATVRAGGELVVEGRVSGSVLQAGAATEMRRALAAALTGAAADLGSLAMLASQLVTAAGERGAALAPARVVGMLRAQRFADLPERLAAAEAVVARARRAWPGLAPALAMQLASSRATLSDPDGGADPVTRLAQAAAFLVAAVATAPPAGPAGIRLPGAYGSRIACPGSLRLTGAGATDCEIEVGGDLFATADGGTLSGGRISVGGRLRVGELTGRPSAPLRIEMRETRSGRDLLRAGLAHPGVEIAVGREVVLIERRRHDLRIGIEGGRPAVEWR